MPLEASGTYSHRDDGLIRFPDTVIVHCTPRIDYAAGMHHVEVQFLSATGEQLARLPLEYAAAMVGGETGSGAEAEDEYFNKIEKMVAGSLQFLTYNTANSITFSFV